MARHQTRRLSAVGLAAPPARRQATIDTRRQASTGTATEDALAVEDLASALQARRLAAPALFVLELLKPWRFVASQLLIMSQPLWARDGRQTAQRYADWLDAPGGIETAQKALEQTHACETKTR
jgi:hypothetical protein